MVHSYTDFYCYTSTKTGQDWNTSYPETVKTILATEKLVYNLPLYRMKERNPFIKNITQSFTTFL